MSGWEPSEMEVLLLAVILVLAVLAALCISAASEPADPLAGRWVVWEYQIHGAAVKPEELETIDNGAFAHWNSLSFLFSGEGNVRADFPDAEGGEVILTYQFDGRYVELFRPDRKSQYRLLELSEGCLSFTPPYSQEMIIFLKKA